MRWRTHSGTDEKGGRGANLVGTIVFAMFVGIGSLILHEMATDVWQDWQTRSWTEQWATITESRVERRSGEAPYVPVVRFRYEWNGEDRIGDRIRLGDPGEKSYGAAETALRPYPVGADVVCFVGPHGEAVLDHRSLARGFIVLFPLLFVVIGAGGLYALWKPKRKDALGRPVEPAISDEASGSSGRNGLTVFGGLFLLAGLGALWFMLIGPVLRIYEARDWEPTACVVDSSQVVSHRSDDSTTYSVDILYRWERDGRVQRSNRYSFFGGSTSGREGKAEIVRAHPPGREFTCYVDPHEQDNAVIERGFTSTAWFGVIPLLFAAVGLGVMWHGRKAGARGRRVADGLAARGSSIAPGDPVTEWLPDLPETIGRARLDAETRRFTRLIGVTFACVFWNGIVAVFASEVVESFAKGRPSWGLALFLVPFVLVGIGLLFGIFYEALRITNARPELYASARAIPLGETLDVEWQLHGRIGRLSRLTIKLEGRESATYRRGTNTHTVQETFLSRPIFESTQHYGMARGSASVTLPRATMHSFEGGNNRIDWSLVVHGEIERWPDVDERYPIVVLPLPAGQTSKPEES